ncbi:MAG: LTA synthase family protein [Candidatus Galacturonibacter soehngenii]|nr:LTA synthase family protein [Candidatus Galacturonibacter soehngenii]
MKEKLDKLKKVITEKNIKNFARYVTLAIVIIFLGLYIFKFKAYISFDENGVPDKKTVINAVITILLALMTGALALIKNNLSDKTNKILSYVLFFASPVICYYAFEYFQSSIYRVTISNIGKRYVFLNFVILSVILVIIVVISNSIKVSIIGMALIINFFGTVNYFVYSFRSVALVAADIFSVRTAASVAEDYPLFLDYHIFYMFILTLFIITGVCKLRSFKVIPTWKLRLPAVLVGILYTTLFLNLFVYSNYLGNNFWDVTIKLYRPHEAYRKYGTFLATVRTMNYIIIDKPEGYTVDKVEELAKSYDLSTEVGKTPNIIVIMNEAFSDLKSIHDFKTNEDYMPFIRSLEENTIKGTAYVSVYGGNTANTEFEFLTGNAMGLLPANSIPYQLFVKDKAPSIVYNLKSQGYTGNIGMHPFKANGFNRQMVYPLLGFEQFITIEEFQGAPRLKDKVTDEANFEKIIEKFEQSKSQSDAPFFLFNVTMQNHGGYSTKDPNMVEKITIEDEYYYNSALQTYLSFLKYTDEAVEMLIGYFEKLEEPTVIIFFGDHQPGLNESWYAKMFGKSEEKMTTEELMEKYKVPFFAWANYDIKEETVDKISMNYLSAFLMDKLDINLTKYQQFLLDVHQQVPVMNSLGYWGENGEFYDYSDIKSPYYEILNQYRWMQYNNMHDKKNRIDSIFYLD